MANQDTNTNAKTQLFAEMPDLTSTELWKNTKTWFTQLHGPSFGKISNAEHLNASPDGTKIAFTASMWETLEAGSPSKSVYVVDIPEKGTGPQLHRVTQSSSTGKLPKWSPDGRMLAFLSDTLRKGHFQLYGISTQRMGEAKPLTPHALNGVVMDFRWSADGESLLVHVTPFGLALAGAEGSGYLADDEKQSLPSWMPTVSSGKPPAHLCSLWLCDLSESTCHQASRVDRNVWSFCWADAESAILKISDSSIGYSHQAADLVKLDLSSGREEIIHVRDDHLIGNFLSTPTGSHVTLVESAGSERIKIVGKLTMIDTISKEKTILPTNDVDIGYIDWLAPDRLLAMGLRNMRTVALEIVTSTLQIRELWTTTDQWGGVNCFASGCTVPGKGFAMVRSNWTVPPGIGLIDTELKYRSLVSFDHDGTKWLRSQYGEQQVLNWQSLDGTEIHGLLYLPKKGSAPYKTILFVHGGPFSATTDKWLGYSPQIAWLVAHGYAVLCPNPPGSVGKGAAFTNAVKGDIGGGDAQDLLSGLDHLIDLRLTDPTRLGVIGGSYGGYMAAWLVTQTNRFAAAVSTSPVTDYKLQWICGDERMPIVGEEIYVRDSLVERRSPLAHVQFCTTPNLLLAGTKDHCTPPQHAQYESTALLDQGVKSVLAEYPREGHGVRLFPEVIDTYSRILDWFDTFV